MICGSCRRRCDPKRSFCTHCGSAVFIEARDERAFFAQPAPAVASSSGPSPSELLRSIQRSAPSLRQPATVARRAQARAQERARAAVPAFALGPLIRFGIFVFIVWYAGSWLLRIPEVILLKDRAQAGHFSDEDLQAAKNAIAERLQSFLRNAQDPNPPRAVESAEKGRVAAARPAEKPADAPVPLAQRPAAVASPPQTDSVPPGVSLPGDGVSMPRVLHKVNPEYTPAALRAKLEGTVLLQAVVRTHGVPSDISVLRSLDRRFGLDQQAVDALRQWRFAPGQRAGQPVPVLVQVEMNFSLK
jgi:TonB family protein